MGARDIADCAGNSILIGSDGDDDGCNKSVFFCGFEIIEFKREDKNINLKSLKGNNMIQTSIAIGQEYIFFVTSHYNFV